MANPPAQRAQKPSHPSLLHVPNPSSSAGGWSLKACSWTGMPQNDCMQHQAPGTVRATLGASTPRAPSAGSCQSPCSSQKLQCLCTERQEGIGSKLPRTRIKSPDMVQAHPGKCHHGDSSNTWTRESRSSSCILQVFGHQAGNLQPLWRVSSHLLLAGE